MFTVFPTCRFVMCPRKYLHDFLPGCSSSCCPFTMASRFAISLSLSNQTPKQHSPNRTAGSLNVPTTVSSHSQPALRRRYRTVPPLLLPVQGVMLFAILCMVVQAFFPGNWSLDAERMKTGLSGKMRVEQLTGSPSVSAI